MSIMDMNFEDIEVAQGTYIGWGAIGQTVTGTVVTYSPAGGSDFNQEPCPQLVVELVDECNTYSDKGATKSTIAAGEFATVTCGLWDLKRNVEAASPKPGDVIRMTYAEDKQASKGAMKSFKVQIARNAGKATALAPAPVAAPVAGADPF